MKRKGIIIFSSSALIFIILSAVSVFQSGSTYVKADDGVIIELENHGRTLPTEEKLLRTNQYMMELLSEHIQEFGGQLDVLYEVNGSISAVTIQFDNEIQPDTETREEIMKACIGYGLTEDMIDIP